MPRLTDIKHVLFSVNEHPVFVSFGPQGNARQVAVPGKKAIVNRDQNRVLGIVSRNYRLVSNQEALEMAYKCCSTVFPETLAGEWMVNAVDAPSTAGYCRIDLTHHSAVLDFSFVGADDRPDLFGPFIRVTNSFNGKRALGFDIGFYRKVCKNGLVLPESVIRFKFSHMRQEIDKGIHFEVAREKLARMKTGFADTLAGLKVCALPRSQFERLLRGVLLLREPSSKKPNPREAADWQTLNIHIAELCTRYANELGENAYAAFNAITEFASHPLDLRCVLRERHALQRLAGSWLALFNQARRTPDFTISGHLEYLEENFPKTAVRPI
ncbi:MAG: DUF932 domain-containing protein [Roseomonas sp.]|nr:DUF932 domain-containing protein [Roseomonas sp.]